MAEPFHAFDIRGVYPDVLTDEFAYQFGKALAKHFQLERIVVSNDHRVSSPALFKNLAKGLTEMGCNVLHIGTTSTPTLYHVCVTEKFPIGVMITASHNPKEYNGFKVCTDESQLVIYEKGLKDVEALMSEKLTPSDTPGKVEERNVMDAYTSYIKKALKPLSKKYKIVVDTGNGVAGPFVEKIFGNNENIELVPLFFELDGNYPNHEANPLKMENLEDASKKVVETGADFAFVFDGDADRCILLDDKGEVVNTDILLCMIAEQEGPKHPGATFYYDLRFSKIVKEYIESIGCKAEMSMVGNAVYKEKMVFEGGFLAAELSGHVMYESNYCLDDGFYLAVNILNYIDHAQKSVSEMAKPFKKYFQSPEINNKVKDANAVLAGLKEKFTDGEISELDGVTVTYDDHWFNVRKSNTEPVVRMRVEADTKELLDKKVAELQSFIDTFK